jgi:hypothetical protein
LVAQRRASAAGSTRRSTQTDPRLAHDQRARLIFAEDLDGTPGLVNTDPYGRGWLTEVETEPSTLDQQFADLMNARAYRDLVGG